MVGLPELPTLGASATVFGLLVWLIIRFVRQGGEDRSQYTKAITELREAHDRQIESLITRHDKQIADLRGQISSLRKELDKLRTDLEAERRARWKAEDTAAAWRRRVEGIADDDQGA